jgi:D-alanyl-D-alanine carboxypeptidase
MPQSNFARLNLDLIHPGFLEKCLNMNAFLLSIGKKYVATQGFRTYAEQDALYQQGRTTPGSIVTHARGGKSLHNFGLAIDFVSDRQLGVPGVQPGWDKSDFEALIGACMAYGVYSGAAFHDFPHVQLMAAPPLARLHKSFVTAQGSSLDKLKVCWGVL